MVTTTLMQSSSLVSVITISFVSAGLLELAQGIGVIFGANLGTTTGAWLVAGFGLKVDIAAYAMPMLVFGVILVFGGSRTRKGVGYVLAGLGFLFLGIHYMKEGFEAFKGSIDLARFAVDGYLGVALFSLIGVLATVIMQSSHATLVLTITALGANQITYPNALALAIGANVGTTITAILGSLSANEQGKRLAAAHLIFNLVTGVLVVAAIGEIVWLVDWLSRELGIAGGNYTLKLAVFHTVFNLLGLVVMVPFIPRLVRLVSRLIPGREALVARPKYLNLAAVDFPDTAVEAVRNEVLGIYDTVTAIVAKTVGLTPEDIFSERDLAPLVEKPVGVQPFPIDQVYQDQVKAIFSAVIAFISRAAFSWQEEQSARLHWLRNAGRRLVESVKAAKHLQKNLVPSSASSNPFLRAEYRNLSLTVANLIRQLGRVRHLGSDARVRNGLAEVAGAAERVETDLFGRLYPLINEGHITSEMGTSLLNDYGYALEILRDLIAAGQTLFLQEHAEPSSPSREPEVVAPSAA